MRDILLICFGLSCLVLASCTRGNSATTANHAVGPMSAVSTKETSAEKDVTDNAKDARAPNPSGKKETRHDSHAEHPDPSHEHPSHEHPAHEHPAHEHPAHEHQHHHRHATSQSRGESALPKIAIGDKVPDFEVSVRGKRLKLSDLQKDSSVTEDGTLVFTFWCSFCHSCRHVEHPLDELAKKYRGRVGVIALDASAGETTEVVANFAAERKLTLPIALDPKGITTDLFGVRVTTTTIVIDKQGILRYRGQFATHEQGLAAEALQAVLAGNEVARPEMPQKG